jgi:hypothetical protein
VQLNHRDLGDVLQSHNPKVVSSNLTPATISIDSPGRLAGVGHDLRATLAERKRRRLDREQKSAWGSLPHHGAKRERRSTKNGFGEQANVR